MLAEILSVQYDESAPTVAMPKAEVKQVVAAADIRANMLSMFD